MLSAHFGIAWSFPKFGFELKLDNKKELVKKVMRQ
jgi:hypothetical protein